MHVSRSKPLLHSIEHNQLSISSPPNGNSQHLRRFHLRFLFRAEEVYPTHHALLPLFERLEMFVTEIIKSCLKLHWNDTRPHSLHPLIAHFCLELLMAMATISTTALELFTKVIYPNAGLHGVSSLAKALFDDIEAFLDSRPTPESPRVNGKLVPLLADEIIPTSVWFATRRC